MAARRAGRQPSKGTFLELCCTASLDLTGKAADGGWQVPQGHEMKPFRSLNIQKFCMGEVARGQRLAKSAAWKLCELAEWL